VPGFAVHTVDATGCGDAFIAGLLWQLVAAGRWREHLTPDQLRRSLRYANAVGALTALTQGVIPSLPTAAQVDKFLQQEQV
jgi:sugar/nucleoside kinase (ribokinase family)